nr:hypothetical protein [Shewanella sp. UCD-KL12]
MTNMTNSNQTSQKETVTSAVNTIDIPVHSTATLAKASLVAAVIAAVVLTTAILPAEYNIDPTGIGKALGLTQIAEAASTAPATETSTSGSETVIAFEQVATVKTKEIANAPTVAQIAQARKTAGVRSDTVKIDIPAGKGLEYKLIMDEFTHLEYEWSTGGEALYFDFHGEPKGDSTGYFESFSITTSNKVKGSLTTPFAGSHGWYWKNKTNAPITVTLSTKGDYTIKG